MHPIICTLGPFTVYSYGLMLAIAFLTAAFSASLQAKRTGLSPDAIFNLCFIAMTAGIIGARLMYVIEHFSLYAREPFEVLMLQHGGLSWFGGLVAGGGAVAWYVKKHRLPLWRSLDCIAPYLALGHAIGRIGCLLNGCCFGKPSVWGIYFPEIDQTLLPVQILSSLFLLGIFVVLRLLQERPHPAGKILLVYLLLYSVKRFFIEFLRGDTQVVLWGLKLFQFTSIALFVFSVIMLARLRKKQ